MPLKLSIGLSRKVGEVNYGSRGATVGLEMEADASLAQRPEEFCRQIGQLFRLARESVDRELARPAGSDTNGAARNGDHQQVRRLRNATPNQLRALRAIAADQGRDLVAEIRQRYSVERPEELSLVEASELIDALRGLQKVNVSAADGEPSGGDSEL
jgi:hypothetical protein